MQRDIREGYNVAVDMDLSKLFDKVDHDVLMTRVSRKIKDGRVFKLIGRYLRVGVVVDGRLQHTREGVPLSPCLRILCWMASIKNWRNVDTDSPDTQMILLFSAKANGQESV